MRYLRHARAPAWQEIRNEGVPMQSCSQHYQHDQQGFVREKDGQQEPTSHRRHFRSLEPTDQDMSAQPGFFLPGRRDIRSDLMRFSCCNSGPPPERDAVPDRRLPGASKKAFKWRSAEEKSR